MSTPPCPHCKRRPCVCTLHEKLHYAQDESNRLRELIWNPHTDDFLEAVRLEAAHQRERWGTENDAGKEPPNWVWLLGYLSGKALASAIKGDREKALHHTISSAAVLLNWHAHLSGVHCDFQPGTTLPENGGPP